MRLSNLQSLVALVLGAGFTAQAGIIYNYGGSPFDIPDGNLSGVYSQITVSGANASLFDITVAIQISGGYNGDLYAYLSCDGVLVPLLNRIGVSGSSAFGASGAGMDVTLSDASGFNGNIHAAGNGVLSGTWQPDGQGISPLSSAVSFSATGGSVTLDGTFQNMNPNGTWTLFFADVSAGGGQATLNSWSLNITAVPEPVNVALGCFAGLFLLVTLVRCKGVRKLSVGLEPLAFSL
jgi:subtilisin-like proprotein convertase family protein